MSFGILGVHVCVFVCVFVGRWCVKQRGGREWRPAVRADCLSAGCRPHMTAGRGRCAAFRSEQQQEEGATSAFLCWLVERPPPQPTPRLPPAGFSSTHFCLWSILKPSNQTVASTIDLQERSLSRASKRSTSRSENLFLLFPQGGEHCYYQGRLRGLPESWAAVSTCRGLWWAHRNIFFKFFL